MRRETVDGWHCDYYDSLTEYAEHALTAPGSYTTWHGGEHLTVPMAAELARNGWEDALGEVEDTVARLVDTVEHDTDLTSFVTRHDVFGSRVDVARFLAGEPECMVRHPLVKVPKAGRVITMACSVTYSGGASAETIRARGLVMCAAAFALDRLGLGTELWADRTITRSRGGNLSQRILVKGTSDLLDPSRVLYAFAHESMLHCLGFATASLSGTHAGRPQNPHHWLPDGALYVPTLLAGRDGQDPQGATLRRLLSDAGVIEDNGR